MNIMIIQTPLSDRRRVQYRQFLAARGLRDEGDADLIAWMADDEGELIASGALAGHTVKQLAVAPSAEGQGAMASILSALISEAADRGIFRLFLCTKPENESMFSSLGFYPVIRTADAVLMENRRKGLEEFLDSLPRYNGVCGAVVCNCDPFTLGHRHLIEYASSRCDDLYVFAVSERGSMFEPDVRFDMISRGTCDIPNCHVFESDMYLVSRATFPAYFISDAERADDIKTDIDIELFCRRIAPALNITVRYVGEEPFSAVTRAYNERMKELLPGHGIMLEEIPRLAGISAGRVRSLIAAGDYEKTGKLVPETTYEIIKSRFGTDA